MLASATAQRLVAGTKFAESLGVANLLPANNNKCFLDVAGVTTVSVVAEEEKAASQPVAFGLFNRCTSNQLYCSLVVTSPAYKNVYVNVDSLKTADEVLGVSEENPNHHLLKIRQVIDELPDLSGLPQYYSAFVEPPARPLLQAVVDELIERSVGGANFETSRNLTVDLYDASEGVDIAEDRLWRDFSGFIVADRNRYSHIEIERIKFLELVKTRIEAMGGKLPKTVDGVPYRVEPLTSANAELCIDYDSNVSMAINRQDYLDYLFQLNGLSGAVAVDAQNEACGYIISLGAHVLQCYAEEPDIADQLFAAHLLSDASASHERITLFVRRASEAEGGWLGDALAAVATRQRRVRRFHTRVVPGNLKWTKIFASNLGVHLY